jgi:hypothetical protein
MYKDTQGSYTELHNLHCSLNIVTIIKLLRNYCPTIHNQLCSWDKFSVYLFLLSNDTYHSTSLNSFQFYSTALHYNEFYYTVRHCKDVESNRPTMPTTPFRDMSPTGKSLESSWKTSVFFVSQSVFCASRKGGSQCHNKVRCVHRPGDTPVHPAPTALLSKRSTQGWWNGYGMQGTWVHFLHFYLMMLSVSRPYGTAEQLINEYGAVSGNE